MEKEPIPAEKVLAEYCQGNAEAYKFCHALFAWVHTLDDLVDGDKPVDPMAVIKVNLNWVAELSNNGFYLANKEGLLSILAVGAVAWADSMDWQSSPDPVKRRDAEVVKSIYYEAFNYVALVIGGFDHARAMTLKHRNYDHEKQEAQL